MPRSLLLLALLGGLAAPVAAGPPAPLIRIDDETVTMADLEQILALLEPRAGVDREAYAADAVIERMIQNRLLEQEGYRAGLDDNPEIVNQVQELKNHRAMVVLMDSVSATVAPVDREEMERGLDATNVIYRLSHILVADRTVAAALRDSLAAGAAFAALADRHSLDTEWAGGGGDLGWARAGAFIPEFQAAIENLPPGAISEPVKTARGWHLITVTETHTETVGQSDRMKEAMHDAEMQQRVMAAMRTFVDELKRKHGVVVDRELLGSLDYGSEDPAVQNRLRNSDAVLATLDGRPFTVGRLTFHIRFQNFHGTAGKPDADAIRDRICDEWITETLLRHEARARGYDRRPEIVAGAARYERELVREAVLRIVFAGEFQPGEDAVTAYYAAHRDAFVPEPRIKADGVLLNSRDAAMEFRRKLSAGASIDWLAGRTGGVADPNPALFADWFDPRSLPTLAEKGDLGEILGPFVVEGAWAVARVTAVEPVEPLPLESARGAVVQKLKTEWMQRTLSASIDRLRAQAEIRVESDARRRIAERIEGWMGATFGP